MPVKKKTAEAVEEVTYATVWQKLYHIDMGKHTSKKGGLDYISWSMQWVVLMQHYPQAQVKWLPPTQDPAGGWTVWCEVRIDHLVRRMWLPVTDYKNNCIAKPHGRAMNDTKQRCLVKCIALFGLGMHVYQGKTQPEDLQDDEDGVFEEQEKSSKPVSKRKPTAKAQTKPQPVENKVAETPPPPPPPPQPIDEDDLPEPMGEEEAKNFANFVIQTIEGFTTDENVLIKNWKKNEDDFKRLEIDSKEQYDRVVAAFAKQRKLIKENLKGENDE